MNKTGYFYSQSSWGEFGTRVFNGVFVGVTIGVAGTKVLSLFSSRLASISARVFKAVETKAMKASLSKQQVRLLSKVLFVVAILYTAIKVAGSLSKSSISKKELQSGVKISEQTILDIQKYMSSVLGEKKIKEVKLYTSQEGHRVFSLETSPEYIFKMKVSKSVSGLDGDGSMKTRYQRMIEAQTVCRTHKLGLLVIPNAKLFTVEYKGEKYDIIAEKKLDLNSNEGMQEQYFEEYASNLNETIRQLAVFICETGYSDVEWRNNPVLNDAPDKDGHRKIALIDIEEMTRKTSGLFGGRFGRRGLVGCVTEEQGEIVKHVAKNYGVSTSSFDSALVSRKKEIEANNKLKKYYSTHEITTGFEPLVVDKSSLSLDFKNATIGKIFDDLVEEINCLISKKDKNSSLKSKRSILIDTSKEPFSRYRRVNDIYMKQIINALVNKGYLFNLEKVSNCGYHIQA